MFSAFQDYLLPVSFCLLCHFLLFLVIQNVTFFLCFLEGRCEALLADETDSCGRYFERYPSLFFRQVVFLNKKIWIEFSFSPPLRMRYVISDHRFLTCNLTNP